MRSLETKAKWWEYRNLHIKLYNQGHYQPKQEDGHEIIHPRASSYRHKATNKFYNNDAPSVTTLNFFGVFVYFFFYI